MTLTKGYLGRVCKLMHKYIKKIMENFKMLWGQIKKELDFQVTLLKEDKSEIRLWKSWLSCK